MKELYRFKKFLTEGVIKENTLEYLIDKYGQKMIDFTIKVDQLTGDEVNDIEYLEDRIKTHLEEPAIRQKYLAEGKLLKEDLFGKYATRKAPRDTTDKNNPDYALYMGNDDPEYRRFYMALKRLIEKSSKNLDQNFEILDWIESLLNNIRPGK